MFEDFAQPTPVSDKLLFSTISNQQLCFHEHTLYHQFTTVARLKQIQRQIGTSTDVQAFRELLRRLRNGELNQKDRQTLLTHSPIQADNNDEFGDAHWLFYNKENIGEYNHQKTWDSCYSSQCNLFRYKCCSC